MYLVIRSHGATGIPWNDELFGSTPPTSPDAMMLISGSNIEDYQELPLVGIVVPSRTRIALGPDFSTSWATNVASACPVVRSNTVGR